MSKNVIVVDNVSMRFNLAKERVDSLKEYIIRTIKHQMMFEEFFALRDVSITIKKGESFAIVGKNGSGKSTLLKVIAGVFKPYSGTVQVQGRMAPLIELGAGFDGNLTARENVFLNGAVLGYSKSFMQSKYDEIIDFAELKDFVDVPVKNFSSGMAARLGFAIATVVTPDILIVDEILSVGDYEFQEKCKKKMNQMIGDGITLVFVSHASSQVRELCSQALWLDHGKMMMMGDANEVCDAYLGV